MKRYSARICWNENGWVFPSGHAKELEKGTYVAESGFGHEEWLFNFAWLIDGYHYAFLQPVNRSYSLVSGQTADLLLYSINPQRDRVYVGEIRSCQFLTRQQSEQGFAHYKKVGWLKSMKQHVKDTGGDPSKADGDLNVRFRPEDAEIYQPLRLAARSDAVCYLNRYTLVGTTEQVLTSEWRRRRGAKAAPTIRAISRSGQPAVTYDPIEKQMQVELFELLKTRFGEETVELEKDFVDITVTSRNRKFLVEIKSDPDARMALRKGVGQILEYAFLYPQSGNEGASLIIIAPAAMTDAVSRYVDLLNAKGVPISYGRFALGDPLPEVFTRRDPRSPPSLT